MVSWRTQGPQETVHWHGEYRHVRMEDWQPLNIGFDIDMLYLPLGRRVVSSPRGAYACSEVPQCQKVARDEGSSFHTGRTQE